MSDQIIARDWLIAQLREAPRGAKSRLAEHLGLEPSMISRMIQTSPDKEMREIGPLELTKMIEFFAASPPKGLSFRVILEEGQPIPSRARDTPSAIVPIGAMNLALGTKDVPIMGTSVGGKDGEFYLNGETLDYARRLPGITHNKQVFGVHIEGDSMMPKFEPGELVYASPGRPSAPGDHIIIELAPTPGERAGPAFVKRLVKRTGNRLICAQYNPAMEVEYDAREVKAIYRIIPLAELAGI